MEYTAISLCRVIGVISIVGETVDFANGFAYNLMTKGVIN